MRIFEINYCGEKEWIAGDNLIHALKVYFSDTGTSIVEMDDKDDIIEIPESKWPEMFVLNTEFDENDPDDWEKMSFAEFIEQNPHPGIIAGTMYL